MEVKLAELPLVIGRYLLMIQLTDLLDIGIMIFVLYKVLMLVQSTKAASLLKACSSFWARCCFRIFSSSTASIIF